MVVISLLARLAASLTLRRPETISTSMFCRTFALSTFAQFGAAGTNQLDAAAAANGASFSFVALTLASVVVFAICWPSLAIRRWLSVLVYALIQSAARSLFLLVTGIPRSEPPRKVGMNLPL